MDLCENIIWFCEIHFYKRYILEIAILSFDYLHEMPMIFALIKEHCVPVEPSFPSLFAPLRVNHKPQMFQKTKNLPLGPRFKKAWKYKRQMI